MEDLGIIDGLVTGVAAALVWVLTLAARYFANKSKSEIMDRILYSIRDLASTAVSDVAAEYVKQRRKLSEDGVLTDQEKKEAKQLAVKKLKSYVGTKGLQELKKAFGGDIDTEALFGGMVEESLESTKKHYRYLLK